MPAISGCKSHVVQLFIATLAFAPHSTAAKEANAGGAYTLAPEPTRPSAVKGSSDTADVATPSSWPQVDGLLAAADSAWRRIVPGAASATDTSPPPAPLVPLSRTSNWEVQFEWGMYWSNLLEATNGSPGSWVLDSVGSGAGVPWQMLHSEDLLRASESAPEARQRDKMATRALRIYHHAKWLAERNMARAAEWRYREAHRLARLSRRSVLAAHALSRLGYFLMHWRRHDEAREVLRESERLSKKSNPLAPYLLGILERQAAGADRARLLAAEERILSSGEQPAEELEAQREKLLLEINYWRVAELSPRHCMKTFDAAHVAICLFVHMFSQLGQAVTRTKG